MACGDLPTVAAGAPLLTSRVAANKAPERQPATAIRLQENIFVVPLRGAMARDW
jgi:hypothetical protein